MVVALADFPSCGTIIGDAVTEEYFGVFVGDAAGGFVGDMVASLLGDSVGAFVGNVIGLLDVAEDTTEAVTGDVVRASAGPDVCKTEGNVLGEATVTGEGDTFEVTSTNAPSDSSIKVPSNSACPHAL